MVAMKDADGSLDKSQVTDLLRMSTCICSGIVSCNDEEASVHFLL